MNDNAFNVKLERFTGPYFKLIELIESRKLSISEISLAQIADDYINYVKNLQEVNPLDISQFIQVASTLMLIKAKSLLPQMEYSEEEKEEVSKLEKKLELFKELLEAEKLMKANMGNSVMYERKRIQIVKEIFVKPDTFTKENLMSVAMLTLVKMPNFERLRQVAVRQSVRIEYVIERMIERIGKEFNSLKDFAKSLIPEERDANGNLKKVDMKVVKRNIIVSFMALLELLKTGQIDAKEKDNGDIEITRV